MVAMFIVTPSLLNSKFDGLSNVFYPITASELSIPPVLDAAYQTDFSRKSVMGGAFVD